MITSVNLKPNRSNIDHLRGGAIPPYGVTIWKTRQIVAEVYEDGETGYDTVTTKCKDGYEMILSPAGTIEQRFDRAIWKNKYFEV